MKPIIRAENVSKRFKRQVALDGVSFDVPEGLVFGLLGENGAGKTTLIRILLGTLEPDSGRTAVLGLDSRREALAIRRRIGYVPEALSLYDWMTVAEIGWFVAPFYPAGYQNEYQRLTEHFHLPPERPIRALSKGMRAKVALALALAHDPELLILDEPTSGLDAIVRREFLESMVDRASAGHTVFLSSHQIHEVERVADVVALIKEGKLLLVEPLDRLKREIHRVVLTFRGDKPALPQGQFEVLARRGTGRQQEWLIRTADEHQVLSLAHCDGVQDVERHGASLEEIFVGYMQRDAKAGQPSPTETENASS